MKNILFPTDFSDNAANAIQYGLSLYGDEPCKFTLLNTFYIHYASSDVSISMSDVPSENADRLFAQLLEKISKDFPGNTFDIETDFWVGDVTGTVASIVKRKKTDLIIMGTQGASDISEVIVGSQTSMMIKHVECPVLAIPNKSRFKAPEKIVLALDDEEGFSDAILQPLVEIAKKFQSKVLVLQVIQDKEKDKPIQKEFLDKHFGGIEYSYHTIYDKKIPHGIEAFVNSQNASMLAMINHKRNLFGRIFHKSITKKMALYTDIPLLAMHIKN